MVGIPHRACVQKGSRGVVSSAPLFMGWILQVFFMIPEGLGLTSITPYIWGSAGGGLISTLSSSARLN